MGACIQLEGNVIFFLLRGNIQIGNRKCEYLKYLCNSCLFVEEATWLTLVFQFDFQTSKKMASISISYQFAKRLPVFPQAARAPAVRWSFCVIKIMAKIWEFVWEYLRPLFGIKLENTVKFSLKMENAVHCLFSDRLLSRNEAILASYTFLGLLLPREGEICRNHEGILVSHRYSRWFLPKPV